MGTLSADVAHDGKSTIAIEALNNSESFDAQICSLVAHSLTESESSRAKFEASSADASLFSGTVGSSNVENGPSTTKIGDTKITAGPSTVQHKR